MQITFSQALNPDKERLCHLVMEGTSGVTIEFQDHDFQKNSYEYIATYDIDKDQLRDFIGALLHLQSKIK